MNIILHDHHAVCVFVCLCVHIYLHINVWLHEPIFMKLDMYIMEQDTS
jgi:hypothetical protein